MYSYVLPVFSHFGNDAQIIDAISEAIRLASESVRLLDVDPGTSTNRTVRLNSTFDVAIWFDDTLLFVPNKVYTFVGPPEAVVEAALAAAFKAHELIDMSRHKGYIMAS